MLHFKAPARDKWLASANRLLKPEPPSRRISEVYERLLKTCALSTGLSRRALEQLPVPALESLYQQLWMAACPSPNQLDKHGKLVERSAKILASRHNLNQTIACFLMMQELTEFRLDVIVREDVQTLAERGTASMHGYYRGEEEKLNGEELKTFLLAQGCPANLLGTAQTACQKETLEQSEPLINRAYWASRRLEGALGSLDWLSLLNSLSDEEAKRYPRLGRLNAIIGLLKANNLQSNHLIQNDRSRLLASDFLSVENAYKAVLNSGEMRKISQLYHQARPLKLLVLVEGETEIRLLPLFAQALGHDLDALGIHLVPAGGKNHMARLYHSWAEVLAVPLCIVLDDDAAEVSDELEPALRQRDRIFRFVEGEFEDTYNLKILLSTINRAYQPFPELTQHRFDELAQASHAKGRVAGLKAVWQHFRLGSFDKIAFAERYAETLAERLELSDAKSCIAPAIHELFELLLNLRSV